MADINLTQVRDDLVALAFEAGRMILSANPSAASADTKINGYFSPKTFSFLGGGFYYN